MNLQSALTLTAIIIALIIGVRSLVQTKNIQKAERKQRLLNEIMDWARDLLMCSSEIVQPVPGRSRSGSILHVTGVWWLRYRAINAKSKYVEKIASEFGQHLLPEVLSVISKLKELISLLENNIQTLTSGKTVHISNHNKANDCELELYELIRSLTVKVAEIKLK